MNKLFAIDEKTEEVIVSESPKGSKQIHFIERVGRKENEILYQAVMTLTCMSKDPDLDLSLFKAMDKVCQGLYVKQKGIS
jgi:hypothetical protein